MHVAVSMLRACRAVLAGLIAASAIGIAGAQTTTSAVPAMCGNGVIEGNEQCDPGPPGSPDSECCSVDLDCVVYLPKVGHSCRADRPLGPCETGDICSPDGVCRPTLVAADPAVRCRPATDACDLGEFCDGEGADCPAGAQCKADVGPLPGSEAIEVLCEAPTTARGGFKCSAVGFEAAGPSPATTRAVEVDACGRRRYTSKATTRLRPAVDPRAVGGRLTLALNKSARRVVEDAGSVQVCVLVKVKFGGKVSRVSRQLVTFP